MSIAADLVRALDPLAVASDLNLELDNWQQNILRAEGDCLVNGARQVGKSTVSALKCLHKALYTPGSLSLLVAPSLRQSLETFHVMLSLYKALDRPVPAESENTMTLALSNGSRVLALPGSETTLRGFGAVSLLVLDEAARVPDQTYHSVSPMLAASEGSKIAISTPAGKQGWWFNAWASGGERWTRCTVPASACSRISPDYLEQERREMPAAMFAQEYECVFGDSDLAAFRHEDVEAMFDEEVKAWDVCS